jgi:hypothetical protein
MQGQMMQGQQTLYPGSPLTSPGQQPQMQVSPSNRVQGGSDMQTGYGQGPQYQLSPGGSSLVAALAQGPNGRVYHRPGSAGGAGEPSAPAALRL